MNANPRNDAGRRQAGVSLIELMVALLLGAIVVGGLIEVLTANRKAYQLQESNNFQQQNLRFASDRIGWSLRMADFWGGVDAADIGGLGDGAGASGCNDVWIRSGKPGTNGAGGIFGYDGRASFPLAGCATVPASDYVAGSDVLVLRYADTDACDVDESAGAIPNTLSTCQPSSYYLVARAGQQARLFAPGVSISSVAGSTRRYVYPYRTEVYYLQPCTDRGTGGGAGCNAASDDGDPQPTLMRMRLDTTGNLVREPLIGGIEQLQFEYGVSTDGNNVTEFKIASDVTAAEWPTVRAVRVTLLARSRDRDIAVSHADTFRISSKCSYQIGNDGGMTLSDTGNDCTGFNLSGLNRPDQFPRQVLQQVVQVRNRIRG